MLFPGIVLFVIFVSFLKCVTSSIIRHKRRVWENLESWVFFNFFFNWSEVALQCCMCFCCTGGWIGYMCTHMPSFLSLLPSPHPSRTLRSVCWTAPSTGSVHMYMVVYICQCCSLSSPHWSLMLIHVLLPCLWLSKY